MWAISPTPKIPCFTLIPKLTQPPRSPPLLTVSSRSDPRFHRSHPPRNVTVDTTQDEDDDNIKGLGYTIISAIKSSNTKPTNQNQERENQRQENQRLEEEEEGRHLSGSDVLWALQKAAVQKRQQKKNKKKKGNSSSDISPRGDSVESRNLRPILIKNDWSPRLNELEKRLQELSETI